MKCPYCKNEVSGDVKFCPSCGQVVPSASAEKSSSMDRYWSEVNKSTEAAQAKHKEIVARESKEKSTKRRKTIIAIVVCFIIVMLSVVILSVHKQNNLKKLEIAHDSMIGKKYTGYEGGFALFSGNKYDRIIVQIMSKDKLEYSYGNYTFRIVGGAEQGYPSEWQLNTMYKDTVYPYQMSISFFGTITITINGETFSVNVKEDGTVSGIAFYE